MTVIFIITNMVFCYEILDMGGYVPQVRSYLVSYLFNYLIISLCGLLVLIII